MRFLPIAAAAIVSLGLGACTVNTAPRSPDVIAVQPAPTMMTTPAPSSTVVVRP